MTKLGKTQAMILQSLHEHGCWYPGCGWIWSTRSATIRLLDSLVKRGLARVETREVQQAWGHVFSRTVTQRTWFPVDQLTRTTDPANLSEGF